MPSSSALVAAALAARLRAATAPDPLFYGELDGRAVSFPRERFGPATFAYLRHTDSVGAVRWMLGDLSLAVDYEAASAFLASVLPQVYVYPPRMLAVPVDDGVLDVPLPALASERHLEALAAGRWKAWAAAVAPGVRWTAVSARAFAEAAVAAAEAAA